MMYGIICVFEDWFGHCADEEIHTYDDYRDSREPEDVMADEIEEYCDR
tara:strand:- start:218 stop:361 length:144 start_codon:yes stop_codon:yes gene_type:complete